MLKSFGSKTKWMKLIIEEGKILSLSKLLVSVYMRPKGLIKKMALGAYQI